MCLYCVTIITGQYLCLKSFFLYPAFLLCLEHRMVYTVCISLTKLIRCYLVWIHSHLFIVCCCCLLSCFFLTLWTLTKEDVVHQCILQQGQEDKHKAAHQVHVYGLDIWDFGEGFSQVGVNGCHGKDGGNTW